MICLAETDIILKLATCDLLSQTLLILGVKYKEVYVFREEALRVFQYDEDVSAQYSAEAIERAIDFVKKAAQIYSEIDREEQLYMQAAGIDSGEQVVFGATRESANFSVITADRKALKAIASATGCGAICARMEGRVLSLDLILLHLLLHFKHDTLKPLIQPHIQCDVAFEVAFAPNITSEQAEANLRQRIQVLRSQTGKLLKYD